MSNNLDLDLVVSDGLKFLKSLTKYYGADKGMEVWEAIATACGKEVKGKILFSMITGQPCTGRVSIYSAQCRDAVMVIKAIRTFTGLGLKEAKDIWDVSKKSRIDVSGPPEKQQEFVEAIRAVGVDVC